jgi:hypothetical protein
MRRAFCSLIAAAILASGAYLLFSHLMFGIHLNGKIIAAACLLVSVGGGWLWVDGIAPLLGIRMGEEI